MKAHPTEVLYLLCGDIMFIDVATGNQDIGAGFCDHGGGISLIPPSTSISMSRPILSAISLTFLILGIISYMNVCPPNPGFTVMTNTRVYHINDMFYHDNRGRRAKRNPGAHPASLIVRIVLWRWQEASAWTNDGNCPLQRKPGCRIRVVYHEVDVQGRSVDFLTSLTTVGDLSLC